MRQYPQRSHLVGSHCLHSYHRLIQAFANDLPVSPPCALIHLACPSCIASLLNPLRQALQKAGITDPSKCYFVDDSLKNLKAAHALGWGHLAHFCEHDLEVVEGGLVKRLPKYEAGSKTEEGIDIVSNLQQLRTVWPEIFKEGQ